MNNKGKKHLQLAMADPNNPANAYYYLVAGYEQLDIKRKKGEADYSQEIRERHIKMNPFIFYRKYGNPDKPLISDFLVFVKTED